jgi:hypothetical protein
MAQSLQYVVRYTTVGKQLTYWPGPARRDYPTLGAEDHNIWRCDIDIPGGQDNTPVHVAGPGGPTSGDGTNYSSQTHGRRYITFKRKS